VIDAGSLIRTARQRAGLSQDTVARRAGTRQSAVSAYESGRRAPSLATLERLLAAAGFAIEVGLVEAAQPTLPDTPLTRRLARHREEILAVTAAYGGTHVRVFGSVARGEADASSDLDLLVDLPVRTGIIALGNMAREVERLVGVRTDVVPTEALRPDVRSRILAEAVAL
jgi:uncharacterized protein